MKTFEEIKELIRNNPVEFSSLKISDSDEEIASEIFPKKKISFISRPTFLVFTESGEVVTDDDDSGEETKILMTGTRVIANQDALNSLSTSSKSNIYIYSIGVPENKDYIEIRYCEGDFGKKKVTFTISANVMSKFSDVADNLAINKSKFVENRIKEFVEKHN